MSNRAANAVGPQSRQQVWDICSERVATLSWNIISKVPDGL